MKRLIIVIFLSGLFLSSQAVNITVVRLTGQTEEVEKVDVIQFLPSNTIKMMLVNGQSKELNQVCTVSFTDVNVNTAVEDVVVPSTISVYPNPTADMLIVEGVTAAEEISIYSINGTKVLSVLSQEGTNSINVSGLSIGVYFLKYSTETFKLIKE